MPRFPFPIQTNLPLAPYTWYKIGGPAEYLYVAKDVASLELAASYALKNQLSYRILGQGSNVLISDAGLRGLTIINQAQNISHTSTPSHLLVDSGTPMNQLVNYTLDHHLVGLAPFLGLPGTVGGAIYNNSHFETQLIGDLIHEIIVLAPQGDRQVIPQAAAEFKYDSSIFQRTQQPILQVEFKLTITTNDQNKANAQAALKKRISTQPLEYPSSGCVFKNVSPTDTVRLKLPSSSMGYLIDQLGLKGYQIGGAMVSPKHANFIVNCGSASAQDVFKLATYIAQKIQTQYGFAPEHEVFFMGDFDKN
jgi:UDP-N-acetylmuramate dehydrogenase